jgi:hypothetical protein
VKNKEHEEMDVKWEQIKLYLMMHIVNG